MNLWIRLKWQDELIEWNPDDYNDTHSIKVAANDVWLPQFILQNSAEDNQNMLRSSKYDIVNLNSSGYMELTHQDHYTAICNMNFKYYPFDEQTCEIIFSSWSYDVTKLDMTLESYSADSSRFAYNTGWGLVRFEASKNTQQGRNGLTYPAVTYEIRIRRRPIMPVFYLVLPNLLINITAIMSFILPCDSSERCTLGITIYLSMVIYLLLFESLIPVSDVLPVIVAYISVSLVMVALSQVLTIVVLRLHHNGTHDNERTVPHWVRHYIMHGLGWLMCMTDVLVPDQEHESIHRQRMSDERKMARMDEMVSLKMDKHYQQRTSLTSMGTVDGDSDNEFNDGPPKVDSIFSRIEPHPAQEEAPLITIQEISSDETDKQSGKSTKTSSKQGSAAQLGDANTAKNTEVDLIKHASKMTTETKRSSEPVDAIEAKDTPSTSPHTDLPTNTYASAMTDDSNAAIETRDLEKSTSKCSENVNNISKSMLSPDYVPPKVVHGNFAGPHKKKAKSVEAIVVETDEFDLGRKRHVARRRRKRSPNIENHIIPEMDHGSHTRKRRGSSSLPNTFNGQTRNLLDVKDENDFGFRFHQKRKSSVMVMGGSKASILHRSDLTQNKDLLLYKVLRQLEKFQDYRRKEERQKEVKCEWQQLAMLLDRFAFYVYILFTLILWTVVFVSFPNHTENIIR